MPGPPALPFVGNAHQFKPGGHDFFDQIMGFAREYDKERIFRIMIGPRLSVILMKADTAEVVLNSTKHMSKSRDYIFLEPWLGTGLLTSTGRKWHTRRKILTPTFHFRILNDFLKVFNDQSRVMVKKLESKCGKGEFDIFPYITHCALDIICETAMGRHVNAQAQSESAYVKAIYTASELIQTRQKTPWYGPDFLYSLTKDGREFKRGLEILHGFSGKVIKERSEEYKRKAANPSTGEEDMGKKKRLAFLDMLLDIAEEQNLDFYDIREEVDTFMFEGHDTTAAAANWACHLIGAHPDVQAKLHEEMDRVFGDDKDRDVTMDDIKALKYLECVIKEALRLYPSVPMFARTMDEDCVIQGYEVPKGSTAIVLTVALHMDPEHFPEPEKFDPDRWLPENSVGRHPYCYIPFSAGMRNCIGQKFALNEEKVLLSFILRHFSLESCQKKEDLRPVGELILRPEHGIIVKIKQRQ